MCAQERGARSLLSRHFCRGPSTLCSARAHAISCAACCALQSTFAVLNFHIARATIELHDTLYSEHHLPPGAAHLVARMQVWDVRNPSAPTAVLLGHSYPVRKLAFSPHVEPLLLSCSYDMTVRLWDVAAGEDPLINVWQHHSEFAVGVDWDVLSEGMVASCGWDATVRVWHRNGQPV